MAAPQETTLKRLDGRWMLNKALSGTTDDLLSLQGVNWVLRKAISVTDIRLDINSSTKDGVLRITIHQIPSSGMSGNTETRVLDWSEQPQEDFIFGKCIGRSRFVKGVEKNGRTVPHLELQTSTSDPRAVSFLTGLTLGGESSDGFLNDGEPTYVQLFIHNLAKGWTAEQIWGFELIGGKRYWVRRVVVADVKGNIREARLVYDFLEKK